jgi:hypothetical protein
VPEFIVQIASDPPPLRDDGMLGLPFRLPGQHFVGGAQLQCQRAEVAKHPACGPCGHHRRGRPW